MELRTKAKFSRLKLKGIEHLTEKIVEITIDKSRCILPNRLLSTWDVKVNNGY